MARYRIIEDLELIQTGLEPGESYFRINTSKPTRANYIVRPDFFAEERFDDDFRNQCILAVRSKFGDATTIRSIERVSEDFLKSFHITVYFFRVVAGSSLKSWHYQYAHGLLDENSGNPIEIYGPFEERWNEALAATRDYLCACENPNEVEAEIEAWFRDWDGVHLLKSTTMKGL